MMSNSKQEKKRWGKVMNSIGNWMAHENKDEWMKEMRGYLSLMATVIATMTFQSAINPPGGIRPASETGEILITCPDTSKNITAPCPGEAVLSIRKEGTYKKILYCNTICFASSLAVCLLLVSGFPLKNRIFIWLFSICMCITLTSLTFTYSFGLQMVTPDDVWNNSFLNMVGVVILIWFIILGIVEIFLSLRLLFWIVTKCRNKKRTEQGEDQN
ncbi:hypothetical protein HKD37_07G018060 [Glycine soja]